MAINTIEQEVPEGAFASMGSMVRSDRGRKYGFSRYFRNPNGFRDGKESLWISYDDALDKELLYIKEEKGFELMRRYPECPGYGTDAYGTKARVPWELWTPILTAKDGPSEFPATQIKTYRWYEIMDGRRGENAQYARSLHGKYVYFPQFAEAVKSGKMTYKTIPCPECHFRTFHEPHHLASHLRVHHNYDPKMLMDIGVGLGYDMKKTAKLIFNMDQDAQATAADYESHFVNQPAETVVTATEENPYADLSSFAEVQEFPRAIQGATFPAASAADVSDEPPAWAKAMMADIAALKKAKPARASRGKSHQKVTPKPAVPVVATITAPAFSQPQYD